MSKEKVKLSIEQESDRRVVMTAREAKDLADVVKIASKEADALTNEKKEGRVDLELDDGRILISVSKVKIEKEEEDEDKEADTKDD